MHLEGIPCECAQAGGEATFMDALSALENEEGSSASVGERLCWRMASSGSIRYGQMLTEPEMETLFQQLMQCKQPYYWRNQKPIIVQFDASTLSNYFN